MLPSWSSSSKLIAFSTAIETARSQSIIPPAFGHSANFGENPGIRRQSLFDESHHTRVIGDQIIERLSDGVVVIDFPVSEAAVSLLAPFGRSVEVLEPQEIRRRLAEIGRQLAGLYAS